MDAWVSLGHFPRACEPTVLRLACQYVLALRCGPHSRLCVLALPYGLASWRMDFGFHRCTAVVLAPMTSTEGCTVGPLLLSARWQGAPLLTLEPT